MEYYYQIFNIERQPTELFCEKGVLGNFTKFTGRHLCQSLFFNKVPGLRPAFLLKKRLWHRCFPVKFVKFLRTPFCIKHLWWLLLNIVQHIWKKFINITKQLLLKTLTECAVILWHKITATKLRALSSLTLSNSQTFQIHSNLKRYSCFYYENLYY